jgi:hypothetical protein
MKTSESIDQAAPQPIPEPAKARGPRKSVVIATSMIPIGLISWIGGLAIGLGGDANGEHHELIVTLASYCFLAGLPIAAAGLLGLIVILLSDFLRR